jgi:hypothetical protein
MNNFLQNTKLSMEGFAGFCNQFGDDVYAQILLEVLLEGIMHEEDVFVFGEQEQEGDQDDNGSSGGTDHGSEQVDGSDNPETSSVVGEADSTDCSRIPNEL